MHCLLGGAQLVRIGATRAVVPLVLQRLLAAGAPGTLFICIMLRRAKALVTAVNYALSSSPIATEVLCSRKCAEAAELLAYATCWP
jgi:hypothetical protein